MVALKTERHVYMWHVIPRPVPVQATATVTLPECLDILRAAYQAGDAEIYLSDAGRVLKADVDEAEKDRRNRVYIADMSEDKDTVTYLINRGDPYVAEPAFIDAETEHVRTVSPGNNESQGWSAHLIIEKKKRPHADSFRACFERMPHTSSTYAEALIKALLDRHAHGNPKYVFEKTVKKAKKTVIEHHPYKPALSVKKVPTEQIKEDIKKGELSWIALINSKANFAGLDAPDIVKSVESRLTIRPKKVDQSQILEYLEKLTPWAKNEGFDEIQINITDLPGNLSASPRFQLAQGDAAETLYVRSQRLVGFSTFLESCYAKICPEIREKMVTVLESGDW